MESENDAIMNAFQKEYEEDDEYKNDPEGFSALHFAAKKNSEEIAEILISRGSDINAKDIIYQRILIVF